MLNGGYNMPRLQLTDDEYDALYILLMNIGGDPEKSRRKHMDTIARQMDARYSKIRRPITQREGYPISTTFNKNFYMVSGERMYWRNLDGTILNHEWNKP
jgi:hypothetical protein